MAEAYILVVNGKPEGPYTIAQLKAMGIRSGDFVKTEAMDDYKEAHEIAELRTLFGFKFQPVMPQYFGSFDQRLLAAVIDWLLVLAVILIPVCIGVLITGDQLIRILLSASILILVPVTNLIYHIVMEGSSRQATYGKMILNIRVCDADATPISYGKATARNLAKIFSVLPFGAGYLFNFFNKKQQCLHDMIAGTLVMKDRLI
ncbi:RDD family protein [Mucilaginibacter sp. AW1-3]